MYTPCTVTLIIENHDAGSEALIKGELTGVCKPGGVHRVMIAPPSDDDSFVLIGL